MTPPLLAVSGLRKSYGGVEAVRDVSFTLAAGEVLALIGPNGAGKSTCFNMLNGQIRPDAGEIVLNGTAVTGLRPRLMARRGVARTFQITAAFASMTARENVQVACVAQAGLASRLVGRTDRRFVAIADGWLDKVGLLAEADRPAGELAYGDLKRLELAMVLTGHPTLLLMDEPTAGMAPRERHALMDFVVAFARKEAIGLLFTEHDMDIVFAHADRVLVLSRGAVIAAGPPDAVRRDPQVRASYLGEGLAYAKQGEPA
ncbi:ABC transporter ATP-binding protein [Lichenihabitans sp. Uapishka_5]|uniref:ABC transporter ATP-binding protein n=1 Tax=Lichenihabitans sp. Uapishka_5 TaxID=3037302 RepID=UPI0029E7E06F|nr:ABC transporter ATP-binding protein [Lichenihabitans sp. Uapishka_5]MDX7949950.1 ABC transporter ATP-binding protein [Lichenihabitans sp. Uapishka_5]